MKNKHHCERSHSEGQSSTPSSPKIAATDKQYLRHIQTLLFVLLVFLSIIIVEGSTFLAFSSSLVHYPTLPFAALAAPTALILLLLFSRQDRETARLTAAILLFFMSAIYPQVNSELAANPTQQLDIQIFYRIYLHSLFFLAAFCTWHYIFSPDTDDQ